MEEETECTCGMAKAQHAAERILVYLKHNDHSEQEGIKAMMLAMYALAGNAETISNCAYELEEMILKDEFGGEDGE